MVQVDVPRVKVAALTTPLPLALPPCPLTLVVMSLLLRVVIVPGPWPGVSRPHSRDGVDLRGGEERGEGGRGGEGGEGKGSQGHNTRIMR